MSGTELFGSTLRGRKHAPSAVDLGRTGSDSQLTSAPPLITSPHHHHAAAAPMDAADIPPVNEFNMTMSRRKKSKKGAAAGRRKRRNDAASDAGGDDGDAEPTDGNDSFVDGDADPPPPAGGSTAALSGDWAQAATLDVLGGVAASSEFADSWKMGTMGRGRAPAAAAESHAIKDPSQHHRSLSKGGAKAAEPPTPNGNRRRSSSASGAISDAGLSGPLPPLNGVSGSKPPKLPQSSYHAGTTSGAESEGTNQPTHHSSAAHGGGMSPSPSTLVIRSDPAAAHGTGVRSGYNSDASTVSLPDIQASRRVRGQVAAAPPAASVGPTTFNGTIGTSTGHPRHSKRHVTAAADVAEGGGGTVTSPTAAFAVVEVPTLGVAGSGPAGSAKEHRFDL